MDPLLAMQQILIHVLPANFRKVRYYGLATTKKIDHIKETLPHLIKQNPQSIRKLFQIIKAVSGLPTHLPDHEIQDVCLFCGSTEITKQVLPSDKIWYEVHIKKILTRNKSPAQSTKIEDISAPLPLGLFFPSAHPQENLVKTTQHSS